MSFDQASLDRLKQGYPNLAVCAFRFEQDVASHVALKLRVTEVMRTMDHQAALYMRGRAKDHKGNIFVVDPSLVVTNAPAGSSIHHYGLAFDIAFTGSDPYLELVRKARPDHWDEIWRKVGELAKGHGLTWGYDWNGNGVVDKNDFDRPHFQITYGLKLGDIQALYRFGGLKAVWAKCDQVRGVEPGLEWDGVITKRELLEVGLLP